VSKELNMSGINGDKARFHKDRKQKIARRKRNQQLLSRAGQSKFAASASNSKAKAVIS
jgi:hypothetical protein